jgi:hypothetical protein
MARNKVTYYERPNKDQPRRESTVDRFFEFMEWKKQHPEHERLTMKGYAIIREQESSVKQHTKD